MARKPRKVWKEWKLPLPNIQPYHFERDKMGYVYLTDGCEVVITMTPSEARRLSTKLASDYKD